MKTATYSFCYEFALFSHLVGERNMISPQVLWRQVVNPGELLEDTPLHPHQQILELRCVSASLLLTFNLVAEAEAPGLNLNLVSRGSKR